MGKSTNCRLKWLGMALLGAALLSTPALAEEVKIASFNIQNLGRSKADRPPVMKYLASIIRKFDIVAVQEVSDAQQKVPGEFLDFINASGRHYELLLSPRTGEQPNDKPSQEQYAFYYDADVVAAMDAGALFDDGTDDLFEREPYTARFKLSGTSFSFTLTEIHTDPDVAVEEIGALDEVYKDVRQRYPSETRHVILGDFNAGCTYARPTQLDQLEIRGSTYTWLVPDTADTTVSTTTRCAYDRILLSKALKKHFDAWGIANWFTDKAYSDHWPVWVTLNSVAH